MLDGRQRGWSATYRLFPTTDGWLCVAAVGDRAFARLCRALSLDVADDPRFASAPGRAEHREELEAVLEPVIAGLTTAAAFELLDAARVPCEPVPERTTMPDFFFQQWALDEQRVFTQDHPQHGAIREVGLVTRLGGTPGSNRGPNALLGADTRSILGELGYTDAAVDDLVAEGVCVEPTTGRR